MLGFSRIIVVAGIAALAGCAPQLKLNFDNAETAMGYVNTKVYSHGQVFIWDTEAESLTHVLDIQAGDFDTSNSGTVGRRYSKAVNGVDAEISGVQLTPDLQAKLETRAARETVIELNDVETVRFVDPRYVMNSPEMAAWRIEEAQIRGANSQRYRYVLLSGIVNAKKATFSVAGTKGEKNGVEVTLGDTTFKLNVIGESVDLWENSNAPVLYNVNVFRFRKDPEGATGYRFDYDTSFPKEDYIVALKRS
ncbi:hypothetical protein PUV47_04165 [Pseudovibrio exalbescens]|uniref:hypothetical protein n=1 Tax=Pseudovibrio exalbescens TaxID=197461 RepID=UPI002365C8A0|nr:hypothetical protein [Pseudovibrio exalbescens]MDD7909100.1 hypothetical protein [Pseudovibrio exalbescens]